MTADATTDRTDTNEQDQPDEGRSGERPNPNFIDNDVDRVPDRSFDDYGLDDRLVAALAAKGITHPFPIQELTLPVALTGQDIIGQARTGTGKTLAFGLPLIHRLDPDAPHTQALIVTPTRELCIQVHEELRICEALGYTSTTVYGGVGYDEQIEALEAGADIVVGTPGRLLDMLGRGILDISKVGCVILDEADEMLDMGFLPDVERLLAAANEDDRHTMLFSATMPASVVKLARRYTDSPLFMGADSVAHETAPTVDQHFFQVFRMDKPRVLARVLQQPDRGNAMVFTRTKAMADRLVRELGDLGVDAIAIHGDLRQAAREKNLTRFRDGRTTVLCATEVAARGIDVDNVTHVVNYDIPDDEKMYLHRIGRTARAGASGVAITFAEHNELARLEMIRKAVDEQGEVAEVFSTSDLLTELFDLPDETPWDHLASADGGSRGDRGDRGPRGERPGRGGGRGRSGGGSDDGRSRRSNQPSRARTRVEHDSGDDEGRDRRRSRTVLRDDADGGGRPRERDPQHRRSSGDADDRDRRDARPRTGGSRAAGDRDRPDRSSDAASSGSGSRTRGGARVRARGGKPVGDVEGRRAGGDADDAGDGPGSERRRSGGSSSRRRSSSGSSSGGGQRSRSGGSSSGGGQRDRSGGSSSGGGQRSRSGGSSSGGGQRSRSGGSSSDGGKRSRSGGGRRGGRGAGRGGDRSAAGKDRAADGRVELPSKVRPTEPGPGARGEGQPRHARRVRVDELA